MAEYRPVTEAHRNRYRAILQQAFDAQSGPLRAESVEKEHAEGASDEWPPALSDPRGVLDDGELRSVCKLYYLDATVRGDWTRIGGLGGVATPPEHRRQGYSRATIRGALEEYREAGVDLVAFWPSTVRFYRGLGCGVANWKYRAEVPPEQLAGIESADATEGRFQELDVEDWERLRTVETARAERAGLSLRRSEDWWRNRTLAAWPGGPAPFVYGYEVDGELRGYALTHVESAPDGPHLKVQDLAGVDHAAERVLLGLLADHDSQVETVRLYGPLATDLHELVPDPGAFDVEQSVGTMIRLTDVQRGLSELSWPADAAGEFVLGVDDPLLDWNDGQFLVDVAGGAGRVESAGSERDPDATVGVGTLARLTIGSIDVDRAERLGDLEFQNEEVQPVLDAAFQPDLVYLREFF